MEKDFDQWNTLKKNINDSTFSDFVHDREVWWCSLGVNIGFEEDGKNNNFERPVLILKKFNSSMVLAIPLSTQVKNLPYHFPHMHEGQEYAAILSQIRLISTKRLSRMIYRMDSTLFRIIRQTVKEML